MPAPSRLARFAAAAALIAAASFAPPAAAQDFSAKQKAEIERMIKDYLMRNPEVVRDAMLELEKRQREAEQLAQKKAVAEQKEALFNDPSAIVVGNPKGNVTLVEFFDYNCGYCKRSLDDVDALLKDDPNLRVIIKDFPILGPDSVEASRVAVAAKAQLTPARYWEFHRKLMAARGRVGKDKALEIAGEMGLDLARLQAEAGSDNVAQTIRRAVDLADSLGINGTPAFIIGDDVIAGAVGVNPMRRAIAAVRQCGKAVC
jgi:protein-disulfide isomerase